ncbi:IS30 family transposase [Rhodococcus sp. A14]|uniref:IS30 family transposase n=1 Tax=Rhodococcus sp. A14 TaxID=1194106 RepID=UPI001980EC81|nr:IS30 family transposase [Rhodococcus sp. A14]
MGRRGRKRRLDLETQYWALLAAGVGSIEACRQLGIGRKTGYRWRTENGGLPPIRLAEEARSTRYLCSLERQRIATLRAAGHSIREVARRLGRSASTVSRELKRNTLPHDRGGYDATLAHARATGRSIRPRRGRLLDDLELLTKVQEKLELEWSPEQIAAWLRAEYPDRPGRHVCHETIYQALYKSGRSGLSRTLTRKLRTRRPLRRRRRRADERRIRFVTPSQSIDARPKMVEKRSRTGDWEGDLVRHEALCDRAEVKDLRRCAVAAA